MLTNAFESGPVENLRKKKVKKKKEKKANQSKPNESKAKTANPKDKVKTTSKPMKRPGATLDVNRASEAVQEPPSPMSSFFVEDRFFEGMEGTDEKRAVWRHRVESRGHGAAMKLYTHHPKHDGDHQKALQFAKRARDMVKEEFDKRWPPDQGPPSKISERKGDSKSEINEKKEGPKKIKQPSKRLRSKEPELQPQELDDDDDDDDDDKNVD